MPRTVRQQKRITKDLVAASATPLLLGSWSDKPVEPVAWTNTHKGGRIFFTSLGHPRDFENASFRKMLCNAVLWALDRPPVTKAEAKAQ